jgi:hypothetical protein
MKLSRTLRYLLLGVLLLCAKMSWSQTFSATTPLSQARAYATQTLLNDGTVLTVGGHTEAEGALATAEIYDPQAKTTTTYNMPMGLYFHTATLLTNGQVLIVGGQNSQNNVTSSALLYDPTSHGFQSTGSLGVARYSHTATLLPNGMVLIAGGSGTGGLSDFLSSAELWNPTNGQFSATGRMAAGRIYHTATLLENGVVLIAGGYGGNTGDGLYSAEIYNPTSGAFTPVGNLAHNRYSHTATLLYDGTVLIDGGTTSAGVVDSAEIFSPISLTFGSTGTPITPRANHAAVSLSDGTVLIAGGLLESTGLILSAEIYNPASRLFSATSNMLTARSTFDPVVLNDGSVFIAGGGAVGTETANAEIYTYPFTAGALRPKFLVLGVIYSPPGTKSSVTYGSTNTVGTSSNFDMSLQNSNAYTDSITSKQTVGFPISFSDTYTQVADSTTNFSINKTVQNTISLAGPLSSQVGVDHNFDRVLVWLNPQANLAVGPVTDTLLWSGYSVDTRDNFFPGDMDVVPVAIYCLQNPLIADCPANSSRFARGWDSILGGLNAADFQSIANADPFILNPAYDPNSDTSYRFQNVPGLDLDYSPAPPGDGAITTGGMIAVQQIGTASLTTTDTREISTSIDAVVSAVAGDDFKSTSSTTWSNKVGSQQSLTTGQSAQYSITGPLATDDYTGPTGFQVWQDVVYGTFAFFAPGYSSSPGTIGFSQPSVNFSTAVAPGSTSSPISVTLTNRSSATVTMSNPTIGFTDSRFAVAPGTDGCSGHAVASLGTCAVSITFTPTTGSPSTVSATLYASGVSNTYVSGSLPVTGNVNTVQPLVLQASISPTSFVEQTGAVITGKVNCDFQLACTVINFLVDGAFAATTSLSDEDGDFSFNTTGFPTPEMAVGSHVLTVQAPGNQNWSAASLTIPFSITTAPTFTLNGPGEVAQESSSGIFGGNVSCNSACGSVTLYIDGTAWETLTLDSSGNFTTQMSLAVGSPLANLALGTHVLSGQYLGNAQYAPAAATPQTFTVIGED